MPPCLAALWHLLNTPMSRFATRHDLLTLEKKVMSEVSALSARIDALTAAVTQVSTDAGAVVAEVTDLQTKAAEGTATPDELARLDAATKQLADLHKTLTAVLPTPAPDASAPHA